MSKRAGWLIVAAVMAVLGIGFALMTDKVSVSASSVALEEAGLRVNFSAPLSSDAIEQGELVVRDAAGEELEVEMVLRENGRTLEITSLPEGEYTLHISSQALEGSFFKTLAMDEIPFVIQEEVQTLSKEEEVQAYFDRLMKLMESRERYGAFSTDEGVAESAAAGTEETSNSHSTTNIQEPGVDEADLVKTDGEFIYAVSGERVVITDVRNPADILKAATLEFGEEVFPETLLLSEETLVIFGSRYTPPPAGEMHDILPQTGMTSVFLYDVSNPAAPELVREFGTEGHLNSARLADGALYYVTTVSPMIWPSAPEDKGELRPFIYDSGAGGAQTLLPYEQISILPGTLEGTYSIISAIDLGAPSENELEVTGFLGASEQLYMTEDTLYLTASAYMPPEQPAEEAEVVVWAPQAANTVIFKFLLNGTDVEFTASAEVPGTLLNQFSLDEQDGYLRVATTEGGWWAGAEPSRNHLFVLDEQLETAGSLQNLGEGERIYSVRFMEDKAYMVTFKETDPLFVIDLADPASPEVLGLLKIPGFSNYLHPLGEDHLIGFGSETYLEPVKEGEPVVVTGGMKISLFDITDVTVPIEEDTEVIGGRGTYSSLQYDHKALFEEPERSLYGFPVTIYEESGPGRLELKAEGAMIYRITEEGIGLAADLTEEAEGLYQDPAEAVQRIIYSGDALYTIGYNSIAGYNLGSFELTDQLNY
ncbi:beta-propeller domain-containing protein [Planococcus lenghuensis]|uniref:Secreted protein containing C-terminal beta-propeller domain n=1 Tax=Planococcus lenghuensis TaxID=2213202 RepID=A0A1Q2L2T0_9BACL|nr:beta-propeller domain-containing protein [Planococcus lenghuensis]AQQ54377.1 hypothetical protein B0X71_15555 [Planococcus lenghuensis]